MQAPSNPSFHKDITNKRLSTVAAMLAIALLIFCASCSSQNNNGAANNGPSGIKYGGAVTIVPGPYGAFTTNFNPFLTDNASLSGTRGMIYETLQYYNREKNTIQPWLATRYFWSKDLTSLTFNLHQGIQWSDGQPFTSDDVVFTLQLMQKYPQLDLNTVWTFIKQVTNPDPYTVVFTFKQPSVPEQWFIGGQIYIVPRHIWQNIKDPVNETNPHPVGTGPFMLSSFDPALYVLKRNPVYWQPGKPYVDELRYPAYTSNGNAKLLLAQGSIDWTGIFDKNLQDNFVQRDSQHNHYWFPPTAVVMLYLNTTKYPFNLLPVRQAMSLAINRQQLTQVGESGYEPPAHPTALVLPTNQQFLASQYSSLSFQTDLARANTLLQTAGFTRGNNGIYADQQGRPLTFTINAVGGWTDWETDGRLIASNLKQIGMQVTYVPLTVKNYLNALQLGTFDSAISWTNSGPTPYYLYYGLLASANSAPVGKSAPSNWERWQDPTTDQFLALYSRSLDANVQQQALAGIQKVMVDQLPSIPLVDSVNWYEYTTARYTGWPDQQNPYAVPSPYAYPDSEQVALNLHQV